MEWFGQSKNQKFTQKLKKNLESQDIYNYKEQDQIQNLYLNKSPMANVMKSRQPPFRPKQFFTSTINDFTIERKIPLDQKMLQTFNASKFNYEKIGTNIYKKEKKKQKFQINIEKTTQHNLPSNRPQTTMGGQRQRKFAFQNQKLPDLKTSISNSVQLKKNKKDSISQLFKVQKNNKFSGSISNMIKPKKQNFLDQLDINDYNIQNDVPLDDSDKEDFSQIIVNSSNQKITRNKTQINFQSNLDHAFLSLFAADD